MFQGRCAVFVNMHRPRLYGNMCSEMISNNWCACAGQESFGAIYAWKSVGCGIGRERCVKQIGSPGRIRTSDQPVNSRLLYR